ncbi:hypothetical protein P153DRAFT_206490 [Dothidotthia symphoricarpi CBS 119687]|uniref:Uncharacterized protein n=1 Tax=Dothidotthia symphoricarpi CBS 119687 TaxID=1392245 RepID=A0A6A6AIH1_9PLEO|nr:uncharacterized protein P153DRAFT_206490 [Dothidotthia symphoricarpi CBS 119687]KAF2130905.1 hypothetical protein P153DRAFT_206490 [Dothidotthia symphoricarpi CBS 119687]
MRISSSTVLLGLFQITPARGYDAKWLDMAGKIEVVRLFGLSIWAEPHAPCHLGNGPCQYEVPGTASWHSRRNKAISTPASEAASKILDTVVHHENTSYLPHSDAHAPHPVYGVAINFLPGRTTTGLIKFLVVQYIICVSVSLLFCSTILSLFFRFYMYSGKPNVAGIVTCHSK